MSNEDTLWEFRSWASRPVQYLVVSRTEKTWKVQRVDGFSTHNARVTVSQIGGEWFHSERAAYEARAKSLTYQIGLSQEQTQRLRSQLGQVEATLKAKEQ